MDELLVVTVLGGRRNSDLGCVGYTGCSTDLNNKNISFILMRTSIEVWEERDPGRVTEYSSIVKPTSVHIIEMNGKYKTTILQSKIVYTFPVYNFKIILL